MNIHGPEYDRSQSLSQIDIEFSIDDQLLKSREAVSKHVMRLNEVALDGDAGQTATLQDLNSQLQDSREQLQELENRKTVLLKEKAKIEAEMLQVEDRCGVLTSRIVDLEKSLEQRKKDE
ncbi:hypothetical protein ACH5RR_036576 [Cinchona calisaya]|uniref:Uncharacterized protein n=1 Tax=Cinchona calisaya TaxID=153742 RepID=A0ABD2Y8D4_9GENT